MNKVRCKVDAYIDRWGDRHVEAKEIYVNLEKVVKRLLNPITFNNLDKDFGFKSENIGEFPVDFDEEFMLDCRCIWDTVHEEVAFCIFNELIED